MLNRRPHALHEFPAGRIEHRELAGRDGPDAPAGRRAARTPTAACCGPTAPGRRTRWPRSQHGRGTCGARRRTVSGDGAVVIWDLLDGCRIPRPAPRPRRDTAPRPGPSPGRRSLRSGPWSIGGPAVSRQLDARAGGTSWASALCAAGEEIVMTESRPPLPGAGRRAAGSGGLAGAVAGQVAAADPALRRAVVPVVRASSW